jgi:hypothetical protein
MCFFVDCGPVGNAKFEGGNGAAGFFGVSEKFHGTSERRG